MNPLQLLQGIKNPKQFVMNAMNKNTNPMINKLVGMANSGNTEDIQKFARNLFKEQGKDFDKEFTNFMSNFK